MDWGPTLVLSTRPAPLGGRRASWLRVTLAFPSLGRLSELLTCAVEFLWRLGRRWELVMGLVRVRFDRSRADVTFAMYQLIH